MKEEFAFDPEGELWRINRELVLLLGGAKAAILQIAHPEVAYGVAKHSGFRRDSSGRLRRTLEAVYAIVFGTRDEAEAVAERVRRMHERVRGTEPQPYDAFSPDAQMWVLATLIVPGLEMFERFVEPVSEAEKRRYYAEMRGFGEYFGLDRGFGPQSWEEFCGYYEGMLRGEVLGREAVSAELAQAIVRPERPWVMALGVRPLRFLAEELIESPVRERLGFRSRAGGRAAMRVVDAVLPGVLRVLPDAWRFAPKYREAMRGRGRINRPSDR